MVRVCVATPELRIADVAFNARELLAQLSKASVAKAQLVVFPELCLTGYSCGDLFASPHLQNQALAGLLDVAGATRVGPACVVGLPVAQGGRLFNCAAVCAEGRVLGVVPKTHLPSYGEFYEKRWFAPASAATAATVRIGDQDVPFGSRLLFKDHRQPDFVLAVEICEDLWAVEPPSGAAALAGATVIANPSASNELVGKAAYRADLVRQQSARALCAYLYASSGPWESSADLVYSGHSLIAESGKLLAESQRFCFESRFTLADVDLHVLQHERLRNTTFACDTLARGTSPAVFREVPFALGAPPPWEDIACPLLRPLPRHPFVPEDEAGRDSICAEILNLQTTALARRLRHTKSRAVILGISGGLDSTLALLVALRAVEVCGMPPSSIVAVTMPGFGTTQRTRSNAENLVAALGATLRVIPIGDAVNLHFKDIGHDPAVENVTYENAQARERTQILMDVANMSGGFVLGTGDLSEAALGWCTFNGDHMSMYHVNAGVPKTLVRHLIAGCARSTRNAEVARILEDVLATPISPELLPLADGQLQQRTEETVGPYELHDFFLFHHVRHQASPAKIRELARRAFSGIHDDKSITHWLGVFLARFFSQQFKRSPMPDGPKIGTVALSPRSDWRMPSDVSGAGWMG